MSSNNYLEKLRKTMPASQGQQILRLLISKKNSGEIRSLEEFKAQLKELTTQVLTEKLTPTLKLYKAIPGQEISSEQYNEMLGRIHDDLESAFKEANNIDEIVDAHHQLIEHVAFETLSLALNHLENQVSMYEFIQKNTDGFTNSQFNTFRSSSSSGTTYNDPNATQVFLDPRKLEAISVDELAHIDPVGERLVLGLDTIRNIPIADVSHVAGPNSTRSEIDVTFANSNIRNIIDGQNNTYWAYPILVSSVLSAGAKVQLKLDLGGMSDVNFLEIEPASYLPFDLTGISYIDVNHNTVDLSLNSVTLRSSTKISIPHIKASSVVLSFTQNGYDEVQFNNRSVEPLHAGSSCTIEDLSTELRALLNSQFVVDDILQVPDVSCPIVKYYEYLVGFDNIRVGYSVFSERSIFVSKPKRVRKLGLVGLRSVETRPTQTTAAIQPSISAFSYPAQSATEDTKFYHGSVEYWTFVKSYDSNGRIIASDYLPLLPRNAARVYHERVVFTKRSSPTYVYENAGSLMFYTAASGTDVKLYRNGSLLSYTTDWSFSSDSTLTQTDPGIGLMKRGIQLVADPNPLDIYTVSYTPLLSTSLVPPTYGSLFTSVSLGSDQDIRAVPGNLIWFSGTRKSTKVDYSDVYLIIVLRRNSGLVDISPAVEEYLFATGDHQVNKLRKDY